MSESGRIVIAGGSGFLGVSLAHYLADAGWNVVILSRNRPKIAGPWEHMVWDARSLGPWSHALDNASALVNLTGRSVDCIKTPDHQDEIVRSRVEATRVLGLAMHALNNPPPVWFQMSTAHIYGDPPHLVCTEDSPVGVGLAPLVGQAWEREFASGVLPSQRSIVLRTSFVIGKDRGAGGGALARLQTLVRLGLGGKIGSGTQGMSWIHEVDFNRLVERALNNSTVTGTYIASAPNPVSQREFMCTLRRVMGMPIGLPAYAWMVRIGAPLLMRTDPELAIYGRYVVSQRLGNEQFEFAFPHLEGALSDLLGKQRYAQNARIVQAHFSDTLATSSSVAATASISSSVVE